MTKEDVLEKWQREFKKGFTKPLILLTLSEQESYPYLLTKLIRKRTKGQIEVATTNIYPILKQLTDAGYVKKTDDPNSTRTFYSITDRGRNFLDSLKESIEEFFEVIQNLIERGKEDL